VGGEWYSPFLKDLRNLDYFRKVQGFQTIIATQREKIRVVNPTVKTEILFQTTAKKKSPRNFLQIMGIRLLGAQPLIEVKQRL
jgi:hypothetical protein